MRKDKMSKLFRDARKTLEMKNSSSVTLKKDWNETWVEYTKRGRVYRRQALLDYYVPHRKCPICEKVKVKSKQWILIVKQRKKFTKHKCICKSCWMVIRNKEIER